MEPVTMTSSSPRTDINVLMRVKSRLANETTSEIRFDEATRAAYGSEASNYRRLPIGVVIPRTVDDLVRAVAACAAESLPILPRGAGTSMCGQSVNAAVVIDHSKYLNAVLNVDPDRHLATVEPGVIMSAFAEFKRIWDPDNRMNPGKLINAIPVDVNLRIGTINGTVCTAPSTTSPTSATRASRERRSDVSAWANAGRWTVEQCVPVSERLAKKSIRLVVVRVCSLRCSKVK
jgi:hypothetical protein